MAKSKIRCVWESVGVENRSDYSDRVIVQLAVFAWHTCTHETLGLMSNTA